MGITELLLGNQVVLCSPHPPSLVAMRLRQSTGSLFNPLGDGFRGLARGGWFTIHRSVPLGTNGFHPSLRGRLVPDEVGTIIRARFGVNLVAKTCMAMWYAFYSLLVFAILQGGRPAPEVLPALLVAVGSFGLLPLLLVWLANRDREAKFARLIEHACEVADARPCATSDGQQS